ALKARKYRLQIKEIKIKIILYNISKLISSLSFLIFIEEFYRAVYILIPGIFKNCINRRPPLCFHWNAANSLISYIQ
ncbi:MAG: hypothetical protein ABFC71_00390, partial [Methanoregula sp.]